ncbi:hypothetical protein HanPI659440_Chr12g0455551 [Helianthus annuus]|nr:hypothetical protein HanPI659440_Chr12g0455551 [Helianthus annuus]
MICDLHKMHMRLTSFQIQIYSSTERHRVVQLWCLCCWDSKGMWLTLVHHVYTIVI